MSSRDAAAVRVFPPAIPLVTILVGIGLQRLWPINIDVQVPEVVRYWIGGLMFVGASALLGGWSVLLMRRSGQSENPWKPTTQIIERGPYRFTRNPMYLQMVVACLGVRRAAHANPWILILTSRLRVDAAKARDRARGGVSRSASSARRTPAYKRRVRRWI